MANHSEITSYKIGADQINLLEHLCNACAVSGDEGAVRKIVREQVASLADEIKVDALGNLLVWRRGSKQARLKVMVAAHMDEVGFMIVNDDGDGVFTFEPVGGLNASQLAGKPVVVGNDNILGVIGAKPIHLLKGNEKNNPITIENLKIDVTPANKEKVKPGDRATFAPNFKVLGQAQPYSLSAKALDNRVGIATLIELLQDVPPHIELLAAFTVQEEIGLRGARVAAHTFNPDLGIAVDCTPARDLPAWEAEDENTSYNTRMDAGPALYVSDSSTLADPRLLRHFSDVAHAYAIPFQYRQPGGGGTDAGAIHKARRGIPSLSISTPGRYMHTATGLVRIADWENMIKLLKASLSEITPDLLAGSRI